MFFARQLSIRTDPDSLQSFFRYYECDPTRAVGLYFVCCVLIILVLIGLLTLVVICCCYACCWSTTKGAVIQGTYNLLF